MRLSQLSRHLLGGAVFLAAFCGTLPIIAPASAQDDQGETRTEIALQNQISELQQEVADLRGQIAGGSAAPAPPQSQGESNTSPQGGDLDAQLLDRVTRLEDEVRTLSGASDELKNGLQTQNADLSKQISDLTFRVQQLEGGKPAAPGDAQAGDAGSAAPIPAPASAAPLVPQRTSLAQGYAALARRDYPNAEAAARQTLAVHDAPHAYDAQFLLAQALVGQRSYQQAALAYDDTYNKARRGAHAEDALVGLAASLNALGDKPASCATLDKLHAEFPAERPDIKASAGAISRRARCS